MPRYIEPENPVGLALRAVLEGELMISGLSHEHVTVLADAIEKRIQDGPADWLTLSDGTTFSKSWVPARADGTVEPVERWPEFGGKIDTSGFPEFFLGKFESEDEQVTRAVNSIHEAHEQRVKANTQKAQQLRLDVLLIEIREQEETELDRQARRVARRIGLELDIQEFADFQLDLRGGHRVYTQ